MRILSVTLIYSVFIFINITVLRSYSKHNLPAHLKTSQETKHIKIWTSINKSQVIQTYNLSFVQGRMQFPQAHLTIEPPKLGPLWLLLSFLNMPAFFVLLKIFPPLFVRLSWFSLAHFTQMYYSDHCCKWIRINFLFLNNSLQKYQEEGCGTKYPITVWYPAFQRV